MNSKNKVIVAIVIAWLFICGPAGADSIPISEQPHLTEVALSPLFVGGEIVGLVVVYDDPTTERRPTVCGFTTMPASFWSSVGLTNSASKGWL
jgi:hypothetical protein